MTPPTAPVCPYCGELATLAKGSVIYPHRRDLYEKWFYLCDPCNAWVGCHPHSRRGGFVPLGRLANAELRRAKQSAHAAFDVLWRTGELSRSKAYRWLAGEMNLPAERCHIGMFDVEQCEEVVEHVRRRQLAEEFL